jgi:hypothetical protein
MGVYFQVEEPKMSDSTFAAAAGNDVSIRTPRPVDVILWGGLTVGILDGLWAAGMTAYRGGSPARMFQFIASGLLGRASFTGGTATVVLGVLCHFFIAFTLAAIYYTASTRLPQLARQPFLWGPLFGIIAWLGMNLVVLPLSAVTRQPRTLQGVIQGLIVHMVLIGLPIALSARRSVRKAPQIPETSA